MSKRRTAFGLASLLALSTLITPLSASAASAAPSFKDTARHWGGKAIEWAVTQHIVDGYEDGTFRPDQRVSEPEFLAMLLRAYPAQNGAASGASPWYKPYYDTAGSNRWTVQNRIEADAYNRGAVASLIASTQQGALNLNDSIKYLLNSGLSQGKTAPTVEGYQASDALSRAEAVQFLMNMKAKITKLQAAPAGPSSSGSQDSPAADASAAVPVSVRGISLGDTAEQVVAKLGQPARQDQSPYGFTWYIYNQDYMNYAQVGIDGGRVVALYSPSDNWHTDRAVQDGVAKSTVERQYGQPLSYIQKGNTRFMINYGQGEYGTYAIEGAYVTFFYDIHRGNVVTGLQVIGEAAEKALASFYPAESEALRQAFELEAFDLANSSRAKLGLAAFAWAEDAAATSRNHSRDMAEQEYFDHVNKAGQSPFDRMEQDGIVYRMAAENIAAGQSSAIFAHHGWMNSAGHRANLLGETKRLGVGVAFGGKNHIYYTQNFYTP
ncbi:S-layer homology domain-containing protein [Paenibacillus sp. UNCCL117]|uniref:CAP-associated domain-containing protein n=1 Tax=unclassified Paenibacillus TaxID=185978 RepID=UPI00088DC9BC|nr:MULTISPECIES: CAP-associated domain-containing protein [unclassified Paenibacillus]SDD62268.1 S-layer homology domain-containing protein [Paenibacillus sp. cl123]SFW67623.1 S-layer homology domain-containing protein [Paenibacillus sp. UNCCL117]